MAQTAMTVRMDNQQKEVKPQSSRLMKSLIQTYLYQPLSPTTQTLPKRTAGEGQVGQKHP